MADFVQPDTAASLAGKCGAALSAAGTGARSIMASVTDKGALPMTLVVTVLFGALVGMGSVQVADLKNTIRENRDWTDRELARLDARLRTEIMRAESRADQASQSAIQAAAAQRETALQLTHIQDLFERRFNQLEEKLAPRSSE